MSKTTWVGVGWSPKGILPSTGAYFEIGKKKKNRRREINVSFKAPPNHLKNMSQMCFGFSMFNHSIKKKGGKGTIVRFYFVLLNNILNKTNNLRENEK